MMSTHYVSICKEVGSGGGVVLKTPKENQKSRKRHCKDTYGPRGGWNIIFNICLSGC